MRSENLFFHHSYLVILNTCLCLFFSNFILNKQKKIHFSEITLTILTVLKYVRNFKNVGLNWDTNYGYGNKDNIFKEIFWYWNWWNNNNNFQSVLCNSFSKVSKKSRIEKNLNAICFMKNKTCLINCKFFECIFTF